MKKTLIIIAAIVLFALLAFGSYVVIHPQNKGTTGGAQNPFASSTVPTATTGSVQVTTIPAQGGQMTVKDFIHNGETVSDPVNSGSYVLAGDVGYCLQDGTCPHGAPSEDFSIGYDSTGTFTIALLREPLSASRKAAEQFLMTRLGISAEQLCSLQYQVLVSQDVNPAFAYGNLGFSSCQGAAKLP